jgi:Co/Zn/Cd efflux system component
MKHDHHNHGAQSDFGRAFAIGIALNVGFVLIDGFYGWRTSSLALQADAGHNMSDVGGLLLAWAGIAATRLRPDERHTYGSDALLRTATHDLHEGFGIHHVTLQLESISYAQECGVTQC